MFQPPKKTDLVAGQRLTAVEAALIEEVLEMGGGYVLDFSDRTIGIFFADFEIEINAQRYQDLGTSKANRLRSFLRSTSGPIAARVLLALLERRLDRPNHGVSDEDIDRFREIVANVTVASTATERPITAASTAPPAVSGPVAPAPPTDRFTPGRPHPVVARAKPVEAPRPICFVAQPFREPFQARFAEDIEPAIVDAGLDAYKVDLDAGADRLIDDIEASIRRAAVLLVDITDDNPNVWYELGYSQALGKPLVLISCSTERGDRPFPFDIRGRKVIVYSASSRGALNKLRADVTERMKALLANRPSETRTRPGPIPASEGLDSVSLTTLSVILGHCSVPGTTASIQSVTQEMARSGFHARGVALGIRVLQHRGLVATERDTDDFGNEYPVLAITDAGEAFVLAHSHLFDPLEAKKPPTSLARYSPDDDIPF